MSLRGEQYTAALNELGSDGWELVNVVSEPAAVASPTKQSGVFPKPRTIGRLEEAADKLTKLGATDQADDPSNPRLLWIFRRPLGD